MAVSIIVSIVLTVVLNVALRASLRAGDHVAQKLAGLAEDRPEGGVYAPWKAMIVVSLVLTIDLSLFLWALP